MIEVIGIIVLAAILGTIFGILISRIIFKRKLNKIENAAVDKIMKQDKKFVVDGKEYDLKTEINKGLSGVEEEKQVPFEPNLLTRKISKEKVPVPSKTKKVTVPLPSSEKKVASDNSHKSNKEKEVKKIWQKKKKNLKKKKVQKNKKGSKK